MAAFLRNLVPDNGTATRFRAWGKQLSDDLTACGLLLTADTGQIDWATVVSPTAGSQTVGYEMRRFSDTLQASNPIFFKIAYGSGGGTNTPAIRLSIGVATDGAGNFSGISSAIYYFNLGGDSATVSYPSVISGSSNRVGIALFIGFVNTISFTIERTHADTGTDTNNGITSYMGSSIKKNVFIPFYNVNVQVEDPGMFTPMSMPSGADASNTNLYPNIFFRGGTPLNPALSCLCYFANDIPSNSTASVPMYGANRTYYFLPYNVNTIPSRGNIVNTSLALLYE